MIGDISSRGKGYVTEVLKAVSEVAFAELEIDRFELRILSYNKASMKVALGGGLSEYERIFTKE